MGLITTPRSSPIGIVWSSLNLGDRLQQCNENHPSITFDGASYANPEIGEGAGRFGYDFANAAIAPKVNPPEDPRLPAGRLSTSDRIQSVKIEKSYQPYPLYQQWRTQRYTARKYDLVARFGDQVGALTTLNVLVRYRSATCE